MVLNRKNILNIIEAVILAALIIFIVVMLTSNSSKDVSMDEIKAALSTQTGVSELIEKDSSGTNTAFGMVPLEYLYYASNEIMDVRELLVVKTSDDDEMEQIESAVASHLQTQIDNFTGYGAEQVDLLEHAIYGQKGDYYFYAVGANAQEWQDAFYKLIG